MAHETVPDAQLGTRRWPQVSLRRDRGPDQPVRGRPERLSVRRLRGRPGPPLEQPRLPPPLFCRAEPEPRAFPAPGALLPVRRLRGLPGLPRLGPPGSGGGQGRRRPAAGAGSAAMPRSGAAAAHRTRAAPAFLAARPRTVSTGREAGAASRRTPTPARRCGATTARRSARQAPARRTPPSSLGEPAVAMARRGPSHPGWENPPRLENFPRLRSREDHRANQPLLVRRRRHGPGLGRADPLPDHHQHHDGGDDRQRIAVGGGSAARSGARAPRPSDSAATAMARPDVSFHDVHASSPATSWPGSRTSSTCSVWELSSRIRRSPTRTTSRSAGHPATSRRPAC